MIERSDNGSQFYITGTVAATHAPSAEYNWKNGQTLNGTAWYRIKAVDLDGKVKYSAVVKITGTKGNSFTVYPKPVINKFFTIQFATPLSGQLQAGLYSISGKKEWASSLSLPKGKPYIDIARYDIAWGIYIGNRE